jgi:hypothetical protein
MAGRLKTGDPCVFSRPGGKSGEACSVRGRTTILSAKRNQLLPDEILVLATRQHWIVLLRPVVINLAAAAILVALAWDLRIYWFVLFYVAPLSLLLLEIVVRHKQEYAVTNRRVFQQEGIRSVSCFDTSLDKINKISYEQKFWGRVLGYGNVRLETTGDRGIAVFHGIPNPADFKNCIVQQRELYLHASSKTGDSGGGHVGQPLRTGTLAQS